MSEMRNHLCPFDWNLEHFFIIARYEVEEEMEENEE